MAELFLGQISEAIYCALFMIACKNIKDHKFLFVLLMVMDYLLLTRVLIFNSWFQLLYVIITYIILKVLYKDKTKVFDIFYMVLCYITLIISRTICYGLFGDNMILANFVNKTVLFGSLFLFNNKLHQLDNIYYKHWNRNDKIKKTVKTITFRSVNLIIANIVLIVINIGMAIAVLFSR